MNPVNADAVNQVETRTSGSDSLTSGVRVRVSPKYLLEHSDPAGGRWVFAYRVSINNDTSQPLTLRSRHWIIIDGDGQRHEVDGPGVVGLQPRIGPGESFEYGSFCPLPTQWGTMEGSYVLEDDEGHEVIAAIGRFFLTED